MLQSPRVDGMDTIALFAFSDPLACALHYILLHDRLPRLYINIMLNEHRLNKYISFHFRATSPRRALTSWTTGNENVNSPWASSHSQDCVAFTCYSDTVFLNRMNLPKGFGLCRGNGRGLLIPSIGREFPISNIDTSVGIATKFCLNVIPAAVPTKSVE